VEWMRHAVPHVPEMGASRPPPSPPGPPRPAQPRRDRPFGCGRRHRNATRAPRKTPVAVGGRFSALSVPLAVSAKDRVAVRRPIAQRRRHSRSRRCSSGRIVPRLPGKSAPASTVRPGWPAGRAMSGSGWLRSPRTGASASHRQPLRRSVAFPPSCTLPSPPRLRIQQGAPLPAARERGLFRAAPSGWPSLHRDP